MTPRGLIALGVKFYNHNNQHLLPHSCTLPHPNITMLNSYSFSRNSTPADSSAQPSPQKLLQNIEESEMVKGKSDQEGEVVARDYKQENVPGSSRKYVNLTAAQLEIIRSNSFNLADPTIVPKAGPNSSFAALSNQITQISLGNAKIRSEDEVFLSEIDPNNIPADLTIRFDSQKQIRIIGAASQEEQSGGQGHNREKAKSMTIQQETVEHKGMSEFIEKEFDGFKAKVRYGKSRYRRMDFFMFFLMISILHPLISTVNNYYWCLDSIKEIQKERMKEITHLKRRSFEKVLLENKDFNKQ